MLDVDETVWREAGTQRSHNRAELTQSCIRGQEKLPYKAAGGHSEALIPGPQLYQALPTTLPASLPLP